jgi:hypothetical protein
MLRVRALYLYDVGGFHKTRTDINSALQIVMQLQVIQVPEPSRCASCPRKLAVCIYAILLIDRHSVLRILHWLTPRSTPSSNTHRF